MGFPTTVGTTQAMVENSYADFSQALANSLRKWGAFCAPALAIWQLCKRAGVVSTRPCCAVFCIWVSIH